MKDFDVHFSIKGNFRITTNSTEQAEEIITRIIEREKWLIEDALCCKINSNYVDKVVELELELV